MRPLTNNEMAAKLRRTNECVKTYTLGWTMDIAARRRQQESIEQLIKAEIREVENSEIENRDRVAWRWGGE